MDKQQLLELERNAHLSVAELREAAPSLAGPIAARLEGQARRTAAGAFTYSSEKLRRAAAKLSIRIDGVETTSVREAAIASLRKTVSDDPNLAGDEELKRELEELDKSLRKPARTAAKRDVSVADALRLNEPIAFNPEFRRDLDAARIYRLSDAAGLGDGTAKTLIDQVGSIAEVTNDRLEALLGANKLTNEEAIAAGEASSLYHVLDERSELVAEAKKRVTGARELVGFDDAAWLDIIKDSKAAPPGGIAPEEYARLLAKKVESLFPHNALAHRLGKVDVNAILKEHSGLSELRTLNPDVPIVNAGDFDTLKTDGIDPADIESIRNQYRSTVRFANRYPGMRLAQVLDDRGMSEEAKEREVARRVSMVAAFFADNDEVLAADLAPHSAEIKALRFADSASDAEKAMVLANARTYQRAVAVTEDLADAEALVVGGYRSALSIAMSPRRALSAATGLGEEIAARYQERAKGIASGLTAHVGTLIDIVKGGFRDLTVGNIPPSVTAYLKEVPGFADFFGNQDYCDCSHCQSILGPAAYFVDLMCFVDEHVAQPFFSARPQHPLNLQTRRPDLWTLELTCSNTKDSIPYLVIINEILENAVAKHVGFAGNYAHRPEVQSAVYRDTLADTVSSFSQPVNLPFEEFRTYLRHFEFTLADLAEAGTASGDTLARLRLSLPPRDFGLITQPNDNLPFLRRIYGIHFVEAGGAIQKFNAQALLKPMRVSRGELDALVESRFVTADGSVSIRIKGAKGSADSIQNDVENVEGFTRAALDRLHRFVRMWRATGWRIGELDLVLTHIKQRGLGAGLEPSAVREIARIHRLQTQSGLNIEELTALWSTLPQHAVLRSAPAVDIGDGDGPTPYPKAESSLGPHTRPLFDRLFNQARFVETGGAYPQPGALFLHPALAAVAPVNVDPNLHRLQAGIGTDDDGLLQLIIGLARPLGIDLASGDDNRRSFALSLRNLTLLYRHARLARLLSISVPELFALCALAPEIKMAYVENELDLEALLRIHGWRRSTKWTLEELIQFVQPGLPAIVTSSAPVAGTAGGESITYTPTIGGTALPAETIAFGANGDLAAVVSDWNAQAQHSIAYQSDHVGIESATGTHLSIRTKAGDGSHAQLELTTDTAALFVAAPPLVSTGSTFAPAFGTRASARPDDLAMQIVDQARQSSALEFGDTVFALLPPTPPIAVSAAPLLATAGGESVTYAPVLIGRSVVPESVVFGANATIDAAVDDWNDSASFTRAFRSSPSGIPDPGGAHFSITTKEGAGSSTTLTITADSAAIFTGGPPLHVKGSEITEDQSRALIAANAASIERTNADGRYRLKLAFDPNSAMTLTPGIDPALSTVLQRVLVSYHSTSVLSALLPGRTGISPASTPQLVRMLGASLDDPAFFAELRGDVSPPRRTAELIEGLRQLGRLFAHQSIFDAHNLEFVRGNSALFGISDFRRLSTTSLRRLELFRKLLGDHAAQEKPTPDLRGVLMAFTAAARFGDADQAELAALLACDVGLAQSLASHLSLSTTPFEALQELGAAVQAARAVGIGGSALKLIQSTQYDDLSAASAALQAAFRARYESEAEWEKKAGPFRDALLSRRRDGLVAYLVHSGPPQFNEISDLYHYYLLDVQVEGCMRTSRVAAAIDSVQLYVNRCLMNLEESAHGAADAVHVLPGSIPDEEWAWRKNYRVWEANRKIFLYPENYIEPELRDDKTPLFKTLEEELLSKEITDEAILEAYGRYLRGFDELARLTIAGSYHEKEKAAKRDVLHLLGVTADDPPVFYYRRVENAHYGAVSDEIATHWGHWEKLNVQVPVRKVAPVIHNGQLFLFWVRYLSKAQTRVVEGSSRFTGYQHKAYVEFTKRQLDGSWTTPQRLRLEESPFRSGSFPATFQPDGVILDPIVPKTAMPVEMPWFEFIVYSGFQPLYDTQDHEASKDEYSLTGLQWDQLFPSSGTNLSLRGINFQMWSPVDLYRLRIGPQYEYTGGPEDEGVPWLNPGLFFLLWLLSGGKFELTALMPPRLVWSRRSGDRQELHSAPSLLPCFDSYTYASLLLDEARFKRYKGSLAAIDPPGSPGEWTDPQWDPVITDYLEGILKVNKIADVPKDVALDVVNGSVGDVVIQTSRDAFYLQTGVRPDGKYQLRRLNSSLSGDIADLLFNRGLDVLLSTPTQLGLREHATGLNLVAGKVADETLTGRVDYGGPMGVYLREVFFHIPTLIANHLNSQGRYEDAQRWYHYVFDPTSSETIQGLPPHLSPEERRRRQLDRNWRYREFRELTPESLREQLTDDAAIDQYKRDPFNPHAIARLRFSAYQKAVVMKYVDNLLDWGDDLYVRAFSQLNPEYLREATLKYVTAQEILGDRPARLGACGEGAPSPKVFPKIKAALADDSEFLMEMESIVVTRFRKSFGLKAKGSLVAVSADRGASASKAQYAGARLTLGAVAAPATLTRERIREMAAAAPQSVKVAAARATAADIAVIGGSTKAHQNSLTVVNLYNQSLTPKTKWLPRWGWSFVRQVSPAFCVPGNERMLLHWDRVEDRLFKLRHCQDINGVFRLLPLFAPEIDPALLVGGRAAGLSLEDILAASSGELPPYRFRYLVEKAKGFAAVVQGFGTALLSALEKRDAEELTRLRNIHQRNLLALNSEVRRSELRIAEDSVEIIIRRQAAAEYRKDYYADLISNGLTPAEWTQAGAQITSLATKATQTVLATGAGISYLLPQVGSPFAMKYGGQEAGSSLKAFSAVLGIIGQAADSTAQIAGMVAGYERRAQGWEHLKSIAEHDLKAIEKELSIAELRRLIATRSLELHDAAKEQHDEIMEFFADRFSNLGLYTHLSRSLQQLHRDAYNNALAIARLAEQAYNFERPGDTTVFVGGEWDASRSGLLAGERLVLALSNMDKRFVETSTRQAEINQTFSLAQIAPQALIDLKESGRCEFPIPEFYFDMFYPGQYRRRIRAVRLTIPCVTGPYTNISAKLTLLRSYIRREAALNPSQLLEVPAAGTQSIATSSGQGDAGVFELSYRDERYMPFEGAGAVSQWRLELPAHFRPFDYYSINDVLINLSYTAEESETLRQQVESHNDSIQGALLHYLRNNMLTRVFSLRQEFSGAFSRLSEAAIGTPVTIEISDRHFPLFLQGRPLKVGSSTMVLVIAERNPVDGFAVALNGTNLSGFSSPTNPAAPSDEFGGLPAKALNGAFAAGLKGQHTLTLGAAGNLGPAAGPGPRLSPDKLRDMLLVVEYGL